MKKELFLVVATVAVVAGSIGTAAIASADSTSSTAGTTKTSHHQKMVDKRIRLDARANQAVRDGTISAAQRTAFVAELKTVKTDRKAAINKTSTPTERQAERTKLKTELQSWATANNFPLVKIAPKLAS